MMLFNWDSAIQKCFQKILHSLQVKKFGSLPAIWMTCHTVRTPNCPKHHPSGRCDIPFRRSIIHSIIRPDDVDFRSDLPLCQEASNCSKLHPSGRFNSTSGKHSVFDQASGFLSKTQIWEDCCNRPDDMDSRPDMLNPKGKYRIQNPDVRTSVIMVWMRKHQIWKLRASDQPSRRPSSWSGCAKPLYGNYLQQMYDRPDDRTTPSGRGSQTGKIFSEIFGILVAQLSVRMAYDYRPDGTQFYQARRSFEPSAYK
jgi:hypothetical protein